MSVWVAVWSCLGIYWGVCVITEITTEAAEAAHRIDLIGQMRRKGRAAASPTFPRIYHLLMIYTVIRIDVYLVCGGVNQSLLCVGEQRT
jgi:hypothetical protein